MSTVRLRRLEADYEKLFDYIDAHPKVSFLETFGSPPEKYHLEFRIRSLRQADEDLRFFKKHRVEIALPRNYPRAAPQCRMLTPVFHPNIAPHAICIGDHWAAGEPLWSIVSRIGEMLAYQSYNVKSPLNGEAARWVEEHEDELPLDRVNMLIDVPESSSPPPPRQQAQPKVEAPVAEVIAVEEPVAVKIEIVCGSCGTTYRVSSELAGRRARCKRCQELIAIPK